MKRNETKFERIRTKNQLMNDEKRTYIIICLAFIFTPFKLKCGGSNLRKFRTILAFAGETFVLPKGLANSKKKKKKCLVESTRFNTSNFPIPS